MSSHIRFNIKLMIRKYGVDLPHKKKVITNIGDGEKETSYVVQSPKRGQYSEITPLDLLIMSWGMQPEGDYIVTFLPDTDVSAGDLLYIDDNCCEILEAPFNRKTGSKVDYIEVHVRRT
jgi:hypothetical protein